MVRKLFRKQLRHCPLQVRILSLPLLCLTVNTHAGEVLRQHAGFPHRKQEFDSPFPYYGRFRRHRRCGLSVDFVHYRKHGINWLRGVTASTTGFEPVSPGSNPGEAICNDIEKSNSGIVAQRQRRSFQTRFSVSSNLTDATSFCFDMKQHALAEQSGVLATLSRWRSPVRIRPGVL